MFITLEGIEGSGKTTQITYIAEFLKSTGNEPLITREPGGTLIGEKIRAILLDPNNKNLDSMAELLLYAADRAQHLRTKVKPALSQGRIVICDRFFDATTVYQGIARGLDISVITRIHNLVLEGLKPDITFLLDLPAEVGLKRAWGEINHGNRTHYETRFENETLSFHEKVRAGYLELARQEPDRFRIIDAQNNPQEVRKEIISALSQRLQ